jgi:apolipoprotein N-acyltransferase
MNARLDNGRRLLVGGALAALSALLLTLSFPPYGMAWLVWLAMVPMVVAEYRVWCSTS